VFSFYIEYGGPIDGTLEVYATTANFKAAFYEKPIYADVEKTITIGNAL